MGGTPGAYYGALVVKAEVSNSNNGFSVVADGTSVYSIDYQGTAGFRNAILNLEPDDDSNYTTTPEEYEETIKVPVVGGVGTADLVDGAPERFEEKTITKTREIKTYTGPTLDVKEELIALRERATQQDAVIAQMTAALKKLGADFPPAATTKSTKKK